MKKLFMTIALGALGVCTMTGAPLFQDGKSEWKITIPVKADAVEQYAAEELQNTLKKISGAVLPVVKSDEIPRNNTIVVGTLENTPAVQKNAEKLKLKKHNIEELAVYTIDGNLYLAGNNSRGALYAVYSFLRNNLDVRWFWPGDDGEFIPKKTSYTLPVLSYNFKPEFRFREMTPCGWHNHVPTEIWLARNFMNGGSRTPSVRDKAGFYRLDGQHWVSIGKNEFAKTPEYFSMIDGKRVPEGEAGCWSNPDFTKMIIEKHLKLAKEKNFDLLNTFPADITQRCECRECTKNPDPSSRWFDYYYQLIQEIRKSRPELLFGGIAYQEYRTVPKTPVKGLEYVEYCQYNRCYVHKLNDPKCTLNKKSMDELKRWQEKAPMGIYGYEFDVFNTPMYLPFWNMIADEMKIFRDRKLVRMKTELGVYPNKPKREDLTQQNHRMSNYFYAQLMWNPDADVNELLKDWCKTVYGRGADAMSAYHQAMAKAWDDMTIHLTYFGANPGGTAKNLLNEKLVKLAKEKFKSAENAVKQESDATEKKRALEEIALEKTLFEKWEKAYNVARDNAVSIVLPRLPGNNEFLKLNKLPVTSKNGTHLPTEIRMYWTKDALHIQAICMEPEMKKLRKGQSGRDVNLWNDDMIELFFDRNDNSAYRQLAANPAGGTYDAVGSDKSWNPDWKAVPRLEKDRWIMDITIPFASFGKNIPKDGEQWKVIVIRNSKPEACAFPIPAYKDLSQGATIIFSEKARPDYNMVWITTPALGGKRKFDNSKTELAKRGWQAKNHNGPEEAKNADFSDAKLILIENYQNKLPLDFYKDKLIPAVKNGAVAVFSCYFWVHDLHKQFDDPTYQMKFVENANKVRKPTWVAQNSFASTPNEFKKILWHTPSGNFIPAFPEKWEALAKQKTNKEEEMPFILARPLGKGMVVLCGDIGGNIGLLENILEYNKAIKR